MFWQPQRRRRGRPVLCPPCPHCGGEVRVQHTTRDAGMVRRYGKCQVCGWRKTFFRLVDSGVEDAA